ncbi:MAG: hypothetical protein VKJ05_02600 [Synechococcaceae cyanobacterium]|nr:hypothetical protein [Synechococcaceae cyanobacterium]
MPSASDLLRQGVPLKEQMATVWPLTNTGLASTLNAAKTANSKSCEAIVASTDFLTSHDALHRLRKLAVQANLSDRGPYLIAWSPGAAFGRANAAVLVLNLSNVTTTEGATAIFRDWADKIEMNPQHWKKGWNLTSLKTSLQLWADRWGSDVLTFVSATTK